MASPPIPSDPLTTDAATSEEFNPIPVRTTTETDRSDWFYQITTSTIWGPNSNPVVIKITTFVSVPPSTFELSSSEPTPETVTVYPSVPAYTTRNANDDQGGGGGGLSTGAKAGIGVGVGIVALLLITGVLLWLRQRKAKEVEEDVVQVKDLPVREEVKIMPPEMDGEDRPVFELPATEQGSPPIVLESGMKERFELESA